MQERLASLNKKLDEILWPHIRGHPITYNHYFTETIQSIRQQRQEDEVVKRLGSHFKNGRNYDESATVKSLLGSTVQMSDLVRSLAARREVDMDKYACSEILLCMEAYYKVRT